MTKEKLEEAKRIINKIELLKIELMKWESALGIKSIELFDGRVCYFIEADFFNFEEIKSLAISKIKKSIKELEAEFERL